MSIISYFPNNAEQPTQLARLVLAKFSYTTTSTLHNAPLNWNHIIGQNDIEAVFERYHASGPGAGQGLGKTVLKVSQHAKVLEELNLNLLTQEAVSQARSMQIGNAKPTVAVIVKSPCLAVRYPRSMGQIRRFQLKFSSDHDYYTALAILSEINCPFTESSGGPSVQTTLRPVSSSSQIRPASASVAGTGFSAPVRNSGLAPVFNTAFDARASTGSNPYGTSISAPRSSISSSSSYTVSTGFDPATGNRAGLQHEENNALQSLPQRSPYFNQGTSHGEGSAFGTRPSTAPVSGYHDIESLNQILPPKRELPFARPLAKKTKTAQDPPKSMSSGQPRESEAEPSAASRSLEPTGNILPDKTHLTQLPSNTYNDSRPRVPLQKNAAHLNPELQTPNPQLSTNHSPLSQSLGILSSADLSAYLVKPVPERSALVESWVCQQLEDDGFLSLCQDIEGVWKRITFGR
ncbi:hypothetical protein DTO282F9_4961 [Paecilomyces variotii]|nr:hypothetical protein DTO282F9_4961 [Paecilomyces variotii]